jgi:hypothetical protein
VQSLNCVRNPIQWAGPSRSVESLVEEERSWCEHSRRGVINLLFGKKRPPNAFPSCGDENLQLSITFFWQGTGQLSPQAMALAAAANQTSASNSAFVLSNFSSTSFDSCFRKRYVVLNMEISHYCHFGEASRMHCRTPKECTTTQTCLTCLPLARRRKRVPVIQLHCSYADHAYQHD